MENKPIKIKAEIWASLVLSLFFVIFLWGIWSREIFAFGINFTVYLALATLFLVLRLRKNKKYEASDLMWIIPLILLSLSFALYENPFFKVFAVLIFPVVLSFFYAYAWADKKKEIDWDGLFILKIIKHIFSFFVFLSASAKLSFNVIYNKEKTKEGMVRRVLIGLAILLFSLLIIVPLLSSADPVFAVKLKPFYDSIIDILSTSIVAKIIVFIVLSIVTLASFLAWGRPHTVASTAKEVNRDVVITGIVLGGILAVYLLFLWIQLDRLWVGALPFDFKETESLVKSGFWQLLFLSLVNLAIFFFLYRKTESVGQKLLGIFSFASILLLVSSAHRMALYVTYYGFSYEKFYASYTVLFCAILFLWLISRLFVNRKSNIVKFLAFQFLWMFALVSIFPVELFILKSNMVLVAKPDSKINLYEMAMLSPDVLKQIKKYKEEGKLKEEIVNSKKEYDWDPWIAKQEKRIQDKKWYEFTLSAFVPAYELVSEVYYNCDNGKGIKASYYKGPVVSVKSGEMPSPSGKVELVLSDGRKTTLLQTISGSGIRYAVGDESIVFWSKGESAFIIENNTETYSNCAERIQEFGNE